MTPAPGRPWWQSAVVYQIYLKSFLDTDGDGLGDMDGVVARLDHLVDLGVDGLWLNPCYPSPGNDGGYDVADYLTVAPAYGGLPAFERLRDAAHERGLKLLLDLVPNHCSDQHPWFQEALAAGPGSPERKRFHFATGRGPDGSEPPNDWRSMFGGPAWERVPDGEWYLHLFDVSQPDFNWESPDVAEMFDDVLTTWFDRGIDGFRIDVAHGMAKAPGLPDAGGHASDNPYAWDQPGVHEILRRWRQVTDRYDRELTLVGEAWVPPSHSADYIRPDELHQVFFFDLTEQPWDAASFRRSVEEATAALTPGHGAATWTLNNHDVHRTVTRYGLVEPEPMDGAVDPNTLTTRRRGRVDVELGTRRATAALLFTLALPGSTYLYQGEELGLPEVQDLPDDARQDPLWKRSGHTDHGRDGSRVPLPWTPDAPTFGFTTGTPWLPMPDWFEGYAASTQRDDPASVLGTYRSALRARREIDPTSPLEWLDTDRDDVLAFRRGDVVCVTVFDGPAYDVPVEWGGLTVASAPLSGRTLPAGTTGWFS